MDEKQLNIPEEQPVPKKKKKKHKVGLALIPYFFWFLYSQAVPAIISMSAANQPRRWNNIFPVYRSLILPQWSLMLQSGDLSALDNADVRQCHLRKLLSNPSMRK